MWGWGWEWSGIPGLSGWGPGEVHGALGPLGNSLLPHHFGLWIEAQQPQNCTQERSREARGEPMAQVGRFCLEHVAL